MHLSGHAPHSTLLMEGLPEPRESQLPGGYRREAALPVLFEEQVERAPQAVALAWDGGELTYRELNARANRLAHRLRAAGVGPEMPVGLCMARSPEAVIGILGILKAGGAYVPLDPGYPKDRLQFMIQDASLPVVLVDGSSAAELPASSGVLRVDAALLEQGADPGNLPCRTDGGSLAYVMYTSGSTGQPKGVLVPHRAVTRLVRENPFAGMGADETFLLLAPLSFDASTLEIWAPLLNGGRLAIMAPGAPGIREIGAAVRRYGVTTMWLTAGFFHLIVDTAVEVLQPLRQLLAGGDVLSVPHVRKAMEALPDTRLINGYGPTENTTFTCCHTIRPEDLHGAIPVGRPIARTEVYVLDAELRAVPVGEEGELYIGGDGLARGYLNRPELTAERFVRHPFSADPEARLYRSGDRVRMRPDGCVEFLGRVDQQVKVRGYRIEPGEIENVLAAHGQALQVVVVAREIAAGDRELLAYYVPGADGLPAPCTLKSYAEERLPAYMVPSRYLPLSEFPLNPNGKVDRAVLPDPAVAQGAASPYVAPQSELEKQIAGVWSEVLGIAQPGIRDNFFDVGGTSLRLAQVHCKLQSLLGRELPITKLFQFPTIAALATHLRGESSGPSLQGAQDRARQQREAMARARQLRGLRP